MKKQTERMKTNTIYILSIAAAIFFITSCQQKVNPPESVVPTLQNTFQNDFLIGVAVGAQHITGTDSLGRSVVDREFNTLTPENVMKWESLHPIRDSFTFDLADAYVDWAEKNNRHVVGHALVWHSQIGAYMNEVKDSTLMAQYLADHINAVAGRYKGRIDAWDVVNEGFNEDGTFRESNFYNVMGENYLATAFKLAAAADPDALLIYNDYNLWKPEKRAGVVRFVKNLQKQGIKIDAIGLQGHYSLVGPDIKDVENSIKAFAELGVQVMFTELDVTALPNPWELEGAEVSQNYENSPTLDPYTKEFPDSMQVKLANRYGDLFSLFLKHKDKVSRVTFWGVNDGHTWLNGWPIKDRTNHPLFFDRDYQKKPVYEHIISLRTEEKKQQH